MATNLLSTTINHHKNVHHPIKLNFQLILTASMTQILILNGPNLNLLGKREPAVYGAHTLDQINAELLQQAAAMNLRISCFQSNHEGVLIDQIHAAATHHIAGIIFNPGGFTHTSVALRDALLAINLPFIEVHLSNTLAREDFRTHSFFSDIASGIIIGLGPKGYSLALDAMAHLLTQPKQ
jgi:3-dehydroquinate dehydratase-2